jgi:hypothetical protein
VFFWMAAVAGVGVVHGQGRGGGAWTTAGGDAQRTSVVRTDPRISKESAQKPGFQLLWKRQLDPDAKAQTPSQPVLLPNIISYKGFKALAFVGGSNDTVYSIDYDLNRMFWERRLDTGPAATGASACPPGLTVVTRSTTLWQGGGAAGRGAAGRGAAPAGPGAPPAGAQGRGRAGGAGRGGGNNVYAVSSGGMVHALNPQTGEDMNPPARLVAANARLTGVVFINGVLYAAATGNCGGVAAGVYAIDLAENANVVTSWDSKGAAIAGSVGPAFGPDGTIYVATGAGSGPDTSFANAVVALDGATLTPKDWFTAGAPFTSSPAVFMAGERTLVAASNADGGLYVLDTAALGGPDHRTALAKSPRYAKGGDFSPGSLSTWVDPDDMRWIAVATSGALDAGAKFPAANGALTSGGLVAFTLADRNGTLTLQPAWSSRDISAAGAPLVLNGVVFAVSNGEYRGGGAARPRGGQRSVLYALDGATGKELWNSGNAIASYVPGVSPSGGDGQVYIVTADGTLYAFGIPLEH